MPQITVNEIDQSVVTRVVSDDRVKILVPAILSFGPAYDGTPDSVMTFTDVTDFNRYGGYTEAEFNPFTDDKSRTYARELIKRGGAVSVVRVNNGGQTATFDIGDVTKSIAPVSVLRSASAKDIASVPSGTTTCSISVSNKTGTFVVTSGGINTNVKNIIPYSVSGVCTYGGASEGISFSDDGNGNITISANLSATIDYSNGTITFITSLPTPNISITDAKFSYIPDANIYKCLFCPQITGIQAKYSGSFGNNLFISISQITTKNIAEAYQYANITVYYIDVLTNYNQDGTIKSKVVKKVTQLETKRVSTNPNDPYYFEDVNFDFIRIIASATAREELSLVWSNILASPQSSQQYSGFPTILLKYNHANTSLYNFDSCFVDGSDFEYSEKVLAKLRQGFKGYTTGIWTDEDVKDYTLDVYGRDGNSGIIYNIYTTIASLYKNFTDPYIYDFDFITSGGFCYKEYALTGAVYSNTVSGSASDISTILKNEGKYPIVRGSISIYIENADGSWIGANITDKDSSGNSDGHLYADGQPGSVGTVDYVTGYATGNSSVFTEARTMTITYSYYRTGTATSVTISSDTAELSNTPIIAGTIRISKTVESDTVIYGDIDADGTFYKLTFTDNIPSKDGSAIEGASIDYKTGEFAPTSTLIGGTASYYSSSMLTASAVVPTSDGNESYYTEITPIHQAMLNLVETRQDCVALFDVPKDYSKSAIVDYSGMLNTSYGAIHFPWCYVASPDIAGNEILMAPSYIFLYTFLSNLDNNVDSQKWFPPAGVTRATARVVKRPYFEIGSATLSAWQNDTISRVNPIMRLKQYGYVIFGQNTTLQAIDLNTHSALESLNVRLISNVVKKKIFDACLNLAFDPNTETLWTKFFAQMDEFLRYMKYNDGLYDYKIVMDKSTVTTDDINHLRCPGKVYIAPTRTAEFFDIDFIITEAGAVFD